MNPLTEFEKTLYRRVAEHPGVWKPKLYASSPIKTAIESTDPNLINGYAFKNLYLQSPTELSADQHSELESYEQFVARLSDLHSSVYRQYFEGKDLEIDTLQQNMLDQQNSTYRRHYCQSDRKVNSIDVTRKKIRAQKLAVTLPPGWEFKYTTSAVSEAFFTISQHPSELE
ncbi:uncharacterized protein LOC129717623 isoform X2 [Wyeomyia smithii]|uniref:uncharacterized protein LOC129717623 isoform X2 n=1 Tax=Wyeomyia smithii TaxID=174621 RepID=UPI002467E941|nr:uncharacterized protein LOC129717623 isoform X2 [Wyeomyia smithii]